MRTFDLTNPVRIPSVIRTVEGASANLIASDMADCVAPPKQGPPCGLDTVSGSDTAQAALTTTGTLGKRTEEQNLEQLIGDDS